MDEHITIKFNGDVILHLPGKSYKPHRNIGKITDSVFYTFRSSEKNQKYNNLEAIGFSYRLLMDYSDRFNIVCVNYDHNDIWTSRKAILKFGFYKHYKKNELELQKFMHLDNFQRSRQQAIAELKEFEKETNRETKKNKIKENLIPQMELFGGAL